MQRVSGAPAQWRASQGELTSANGENLERRPAVVAIGNFDGVHRGHQALIGAAVEHARRSGCAADVLTFAPHPRKFFQPDAPPFQLTSPDLKARRISALGVDRLYSATFDAALAGLTAASFAESVLVEGLNASCVFTGADFRFGAKRAGDFAALQTLGARLGFEAVAIEPVGDDAEVYSSTGAREALVRGAPEDAARILGDWHRVEGRVEVGDQRGRDLGYPTANLSFGEALRPAFGVYATRVEVRDGPHQGGYDSVASIGMRPTFDATVENFEVHLFDFSGDLYGAEISVELRRFLRPELKFDTVDALIAQMDRDSEAARATLAEAKAPWGD